MRKIKAKSIVLLLVLLASCFLLIEQPSTRAQSGSNIVNIPITFHGYSMLLSDPNGSFCVFDGADGAVATSTIGKQTGLVSEISGTQSGFSYWSSSVLWVIKLESDLHVVGTVNVKAYISSTFSLSGLFSGGGYGFGLVDIDQNNNEVQEFITQGPISIGRNPFSASPTQYSLNVNVDYVFKKGHSIGFAVGLGATTQGFTATVYFDSINQNSGATIPVEDTSQSTSFIVNYNDASHKVAVTSNSAIEGLQFNSESSGLSFTAQLINYTSGFCNVSIPKTLMQKPYTVTQSSHTIASTLTENSTYYHVYFTNTRCSIPIQITGTPLSPTASPTSSATSGPSSTPDSSNSPSSTPQTSKSPNSTPTPPVSSTVSSTSTPSIPEFSWLVVLPLLALMLFVAVKFKTKKSADSKNKRLSG